MEAYAFYPEILITEDGRKGIAMNESVNRRAFMGATGTVLSLGMGGCATLPARQDWAVAAAVPEGGIHSLVEQTPLMDTHEHLPPESKRVKAVDDKDDVPAPDFGMLFSHYADSELRVAGMPEEAYRKMIGRKLSPKEKWKLVAPYYGRCRHTGYLLNVRESVCALYGEEDIREDNCEEISRRLRADIQPGFYRKILRDVANIEHAQINCLQSPIYRESEAPDDLLSFDLTTVNIATGINRKVLRECAGAEVTTLKMAHETIDKVFEKYGGKAIAVKDQCAYGRRLNFEDVPDNEAEPLFMRFAAKEDLTAQETKALQDNLFRRCVRLAAEYNLPIKLHTGYAAGHDSMDLSRVRDNLCDVSRLAHDFPETRFVLMHMAYPYQHELIALCKQYSNIYADMCWAWIIDPASATQFLKAFIMAAPACKLCTFGGDYIPVELVPGHARIARRGITLAITQLLTEGWLRESDAPALIDRIMRGNAHELYDLKRVFKG